MNQPSERLRQRRAAKARLAEITGHRANVVVVHYSCQSLYDRPDGESPRITSIAVRNAATSQTTSFSIHQVAEREKNFSIADLSVNCDQLERKMLKEFYEYAKEHQHCIWVHWNMRDINYGFPALAHRCRVLGGKPFEFPESQLFDLARFLVDFYGVDYIGHPRLVCLVRKNSITDRNFLTGEEEAKAFDDGEYVKLHQSTLRKVDVLVDILERAAQGILKTNARRKEIYGGYFAFAVETIREHWLFALLGAIGAIASIIALVLYTFGGSGGG